MAEWYPTYLLRYTTATIGQSGLVVGAATVVGGIVGNVLGKFGVHTVHVQYACGVRTVCVL